MLDRESRAWSVVSAELALQRDMLKALAQDLLERVQRAGAAAATVIDTNVLLQHQRPDFVPWDVIVGHVPVRLIVPLRVVDEIDAKKYARRSDLADRARGLLPWLEGVVANGPGTIRENVTIEVLIDERRQMKPQDADRDVADTCHELRQFGTPDVTLVTADTGMLLRARGQGIRSVKMPAAYRGDPAPQADSGTA